MNLTFKSFILVPVLTMATIMMILNLNLSKKSMMNKQKLSPFECGFNQMSKKRLPFSLHFFLIAIIYLIFDIEIVIIMPMIFTMKFSMIEMWMYTSMSFMIMILMGLYFEWMKGMLKWSN